MMEAECPESIVKLINNYVDDNTFNQEDIPNLLNRNLENIFLNKKFSDENGITSFLENLGNSYLSQGYYTFSSVDESTQQSIAFLNDNIFGSKEYKDCWVNRYFENHYTPIHTHSGSLSGVMFLKIPKIDIDDTMDGVLEFVFGESNAFSTDRWRPEQKVGKVIIFPSWLKHVAYPTKISEERRTMSFNLQILYNTQGTKSKSGFNYK